jgi:hypothetical protein
VAPWKAFIVANILSLLAIAPRCAAQSPTLDDSDLVVAGVSTGADSSVVLRTLGRPDSVRPDLDHLRLPVWYYRGLVVDFGWGNRG